MAAPVERPGSHPEPPVDLLERELPVIQAKEPWCADSQDPP